MSDRGSQLFETASNGQGLSGPTIARDGVRRSGRLRIESNLLELAADAFADLVAELEPRRVRLGRNADFSAQTRGANAEEVSWNPAGG